MTRVERDHVRLRRHEDRDRVERREVRERIDLDLLEVVDVVLVDARDAADQDALRIDVGQRGELRAGGDDEVAGARRSCPSARGRRRAASPPPAPCCTSPYALRLEVGRGDGARRVGEQRHAREAGRDARHLADEPVGRHDGSFTRTPCFDPADTVTCCSMSRRAAHEHARVHRSEVLREARARARSRGAAAAARSRSAPTARSRTAGAARRTSFFSFWFSERARRRARRTSCRRRGTAGRPGWRRPRRASSTVAPTFWTPWSGPSDVSRNETVIRASESDDQADHDGPAQQRRPERAVGEVEAGRRTRGVQHRQPGDPVAGTRCHELGP